MNPARPPHHAHAHGSRLSRAQRIATYAAFTLAWLSGAAWLLFHYFLRVQGEFALEPHPLERWWLRLHGLCAFALLWLGGVIWALHVRHGLRWPQRRRSGIAITLVFFVLAATGYLVYYADDGAARDAIVVLHWALGLSLLVPVALHTVPAVVARWRGGARQGESQQRVS